MMGGREGRIEEFVYHTTEISVKDTTGKHEGETLSAEDVPVW